MSAPWFDPNLHAWIPGTLLGVAGGLWGAVAGWLAPQGRGKAFVYASGLLLVGLSVVSLIAGLVAMTSAQPYGVWYGLLLPGVLGAISLTWAPGLVRKRYREAEGRKIEARDLTI